MSSAPFAVLPSQLPTSAGVPEKLMRPSAVRGAGRPCDRSRNWAAALSESALTPALHASSKARRALRIIVVSPLNTEEMLRRPRRRRQWKLFLDLRYGLTH